MNAPSPLRHALLDACGVIHGFGVRGSVAPAGCVRPRQVHGAAVMTARPDAGEGVEEAEREAEGRARALGQGDGERPG